MAKVNLTLPNLDLDNLNDSQIIRKIASYLYIQNEQLRYELTHIDEENMSSESSTTVQGMTQNQIQKAIAEAVRNNKEIDLSSNTIIVNLQRRIDNLGKLQEQDSKNITRISQELGSKVSQTTYNSGISSLKKLIEGNTRQISSMNQSFQSQINQLNQSFQAHLIEYGNHRHSIYINNSTGVISMGGPTATPSNPNISATTYFKNAVAAARKTGEEQGKREWRPDQITQDGDKIYILNAAGDTIGGPYAIDTQTAYTNGYNQAKKEWRPDQITQNGDKISILNAAGDTIGGPYAIDTQTAYTNGYNKAKKEWRPDQITQNGNKISILNAAGDTIGGPYAIDTSAAYNSGWNDCIDACEGGYYLDDYSNYNSGDSITLYRRSTNAYGDVSYNSAGYHVWRYGGSRVYRYTIPNKK